MSESVQSTDQDNKTEKRSYGTTCSFCKRPFQLGYVWLEKGARIDRLRSEIARLGGIPHSDICPYAKCKAPNSLALDRVIFLDVPAPQSV